MPSRTVIKHPIGSRPGMISLASPPITAPKTIQPISENIFSDPFVWQVHQFGYEHEQARCPPHDSGVLAHPALEAFGWTATPALRAM
jgi:hypothetical protein